MTKEEMKRRSKECGNHFFDKETMRFFKSRISTEPIAVEMQYFITSEPDYKREDRRYTVRCFNPRKGRVEDVSEFREFKTLRQAKKYLEEEVTGWIST